MALSTPWIRLLMRESKRKQFKGAVLSMEQAAALISGLGVRVM